MHSPALGIAVDSALDSFRFALKDNPNRSCVNIYVTDLYQGVINPIYSWTLFVTTRTLETTQGPIDDFFVQVTFKCYLPEEASVGD